MRVLFVSDNDQVRGPMARVLGDHHAREMKQHDLAFDSAGLHVPSAEHAQEPVVRFLAERGLRIGNHRSKQLSGKVVENADVVACMTEHIAGEAKRMLGSPNSGKVVVLNTAVEFDDDSDIESPPRPHPTAYLGLLARLRAAVARLTRMVQDGYSIQEFGVTYERPAAPPPPALDEKTRLYLAGLLLQMVQRAFEPPSTENLREALSDRGHEVSEWDLEEVLKQDMHGRIHRDSRGYWHGGPGRPRGAPGEQRRPAAHERPRPSRPHTPPPAEEKPKAEKPGGKLTIEDALKILDMKLELDFEEGQKKYRSLLKRYHPDKFHDDPEFLRMAEAKTKSINQAWDMVGEKLKR